MAPHLRDVLTRVVGLFFVGAWIGLLMLLARGYHTLVLILVGVMLGINALIFLYDRPNTLVGLIVTVAIGLLALLTGGHQNLALLLMGTIFGLGALTFAYQTWRLWYPDLQLGLALRPYFFRLIQLGAVALAYVQIRLYLNELTEVDPNNFPIALATLTALLAVPTWLVLIPLVALPLFIAYFTVSVVLGWIETIRRELGFSDIQTLSPHRWGWRAIGLFSLSMTCTMVAVLSAEHPFVRRAARIIVTNVLVATEYSYDRTCAASQEDRWVAPLKERRELKASRVSIADVHSMRNITFTTGTCDQAIQP